MLQYSVQTNYNMQYIMGYNIIEQNKIWDSIIYIHTHIHTHTLAAFYIHIQSTNKKKKLLFGYRQFVFNCLNFGNLAAIHILYSDNCTAIQDNK